VVVRQNGYVIYQNTVAPGAFEINDLYPTGSSGDLQVTVKETDGSERHFVVPYASVPVLQREKHLRYSVTAGRYRSYDKDVKKRPSPRAASFMACRTDSPPTVACSKAAIISHRRWAPVKTLAILARFLST
jgi:outer membrane usher protein FimD/PapC